jgi:hypothetical protein
VRARPTPEEEHLDAVCSLATLGRMRGYDRRTIARMLECFTDRIPFDELERIADDAIEVVDEDPRFVAGRWVGEPAR